MDHPKNKGRLSDAIHLEQDEPILSHDLKLHFRKTDKHYNVTKQNQFAHSVA